VFYTFDGTNYHEIATKDWVNSKEYWVYQINPSFGTITGTLSGNVSAGAGSVTALNGYISGYSIYGTQFFVGGTAGVTDNITFTDYFGSQKSLRFNHGIYIGS
jgi:hypothetical protein